MKVLIFLAFFVSATSYADIPQKNHTQKEFEQAIEINRAFEHRVRVRKVVKGSPVLETDRFEYVLIHGDDRDRDNLKEYHEKLARNLPKEMKLVIVVPPSKAGLAKKKFLKWLPAERVIVASGEDMDSSEVLGSLIWGRDAYPIPVYTDDAKNVELVAHGYFSPSFSADAIADAVNAQNLVDAPFVAVGGNLMATAKGECFVVRGQRMFGLSQQTLREFFRCKAVMYFPWISGIGDIDEVVKVLPNNVVLTNQPEYVETLSDLGYEVVMLPKASGGRYRTYANSVILNKTVFMPIYDVPEDKEAERVYESFGYKVIGIHSESLSDTSLGSVHCLTMTYPQMNQRKLLKSLRLVQK